MKGLSFIALILFVLLQVNLGANTRRNSNKREDYRITVKMLLGKSQNTSACAGNPRAKKRESAPNSEDNGYAVHDC